MNAFTHPPQETSPPPKKKNSLRLLGLGILALLGIVWLVLVLRTPGLRPVVIFPYKDAILTPDASTHDLGVVKTDDKVKSTFYLYNTGGKHLRIFNVDVSCGCTVTKVSKRVIEPGDFTRLEVTLDTSIKLGKVKKTITVHSNDPAHPVYRLYLVGDVTHQMEGHARLDVKDPLVLFKGECAKCHVEQGRGKVGQELFVADCAMCHGMQGEGKTDIGPTLISDQFKDLTHVEKIRRTIAQGSAHSPEMPPFSEQHGGPLNESEIDSLIAFLKYQSLVASKHAADDNSQAE